MLRRNKWNIQEELTHLFIFDLNYRNHPSVVIQSILQRYFSKVSYFVGTIYKHHDCERVQMHSADAVIILCDKKCTSPDAEDAGNITRFGFHCSKVLIKSCSPSKIPKMFDSSKIMISFKTYNMYFFTFPSE